MSDLSTDDGAACAKRYTHLEQRTTKVSDPNRLVSLLCQQHPRDTRIAISGAAQRLTNCSTARGSRVSKSISFAHSGTIAMRAICWYSPRTWVSNSGNPASPTIFLDPARYSGGTPSTTSTLAVPRTSSTCGGKVVVSIVSATLGFTCRARTFAACGGVQTTNSVPVQSKAIGIARGAPSRPVY